MGGVSKQFCGVGCGYIADSNAATRNHASQICVMYHTTETESFVFRLFSCLLTYQMLVTDTHYCFTRFMIMFSSKLLHNINIGLSKTFQVLS